MLRAAAVPCSGCPFRRDGGVRLTRRRAQEIGRYFTDRDGAIFPCHKTTIDVETGDGSERASGPRSRLCIGGVAYARNCGRESTMTQLAVRLGVAPEPSLEVRRMCFDSETELMAAQPH